MVEPLSSEAYLVTGSRPCFGLWSIPLSLAFGPPWGEHAYSAWCTGPSQAQSSRTKWSWPKTPETVSQKENFPHCNLFILRILTQWSKPDSHWVPMQSLCQFLCNFRDVAEFEDGADWNVVPWIGWWFLLEAFLGFPIHLRTSEKSKRGGDSPSGSHW